MKKYVMLTWLLAVFAMATSAQKNQTLMKTLVAYFSASGITQNVATQLAKALKADLFQIEPAVPYTDADLDWRDKNSRSTIEMKDKTSRPKIKSTIQNLDQYDRILIGFPIWWYTCPTIINTFIESYDFKGKQLILFATSGGSTIRQAVKDLKTTYVAYDWQNGYLLNEQQDIDALVKQLN